MKKRSGFTVMARLIGLVRPLAGYMVLAIGMGLIGHLCASFITIFGGWAMLDLLGFETPVPLKAVFVCVLAFALVRGVFRYAEQACNHFIAFKLLALLRDRVFRALRRLCPAKLEGRDKGDLISVITSDIELLEVFYAHTISPAVIAALFTVILCVFIGRFHWALGLLALTAYVTVGVLIPLVTSRLSGDAGLRLRMEAGALAGFVLDSLRGLSETIQFGRGRARLDEMNARTDALAGDEARMKRVAGRNTAVTNTVILLFDLAMLLTSAALCRAGRVGFDGVLIPTVALFSSFGPAIALAALGSTLQNTFAAGNRVLDILDETPAVAEVTGEAEIGFDGAAAENVTFSYGGDPRSRLRGHPGARRRRHRRPQRQRQVDAPEAPHALLGRAQGACAHLRDGHRAREHREPAGAGGLRDAGNAPVPGHHPRQPPHRAPRHDGRGDRRRLPQGVGTRVHRGAAAGV